MTTQTARMNSENTAALRKLVKESNNSLLTFAIATNLAVAKGLPALRKVFGKGKR